MYPLHSAFYSFTLTDLWVCLVVVLLGTNPSTGQLVAHGVCQRQIIVALGGDITILHHRVVNVPTERLLHVVNVLGQREPPHGNLPPSLLAGLPSGGHRWSASGRRAQKPRLGLDCTVAGGNGQ